MNDNPIVNNAMLCYKGVQVGVAKWFVRIIYNGSYEVTKHDSTFGAHLVGLWNITIGCLEGCVGRPRF